MAAIDSITLGNLNIIEVDADPTISGVSAVIGSVAILNDGSNANTWSKIGAGDTDWSIHTQIFGTEFQWDESTGESSTNSLSYVRKLRLTTTSLPAGEYRIGWSYNWSHNSTISDFEARVFLNDSITIEDHRQEPKDSGTDQRYQNGGFSIRTLSGINTIDIDWRTDNAGNTAFIRETRLEIWRIS